MDLSYASVAPFIKVPVPAALVTKVTAWQTSIAAELVERYGALLTDPRAPIFQNLCGEALGRRIVQPTTNIRNQSTGPSSIGYADALGGWFLPAEVARMDAICNGGGGIRSFRAAAPDGQRYGNIVRVYDTVDETGEGDILIGGS